MAPNPPSRMSRMSARHEQSQRDRDLEAWMDKALGVRHADPEPVLRDL